MRSETAHKSCKLHPFAPLPWLAVSGHPHTPSGQLHPLGTGLKGERPVSITPQGTLPSWRAGPQSTLSSTWCCHGGSPGQRKWLMTSWQQWGQKQGKTALWHRTWLHVPLLRDSTRPGLPLGGTARDRPATRAPPRGQLMTPCWAHPRGSLNAQGPERLWDVSVCSAF